MKILFLSSLFPNAYDPLRAVFNWNLLLALRQKGHAIYVLSPVSWLTRYFSRKRDVDFRSRLKAAHLEAEYPTFFYTPKVFRSHYGSFLWWSVGAHLERAISRVKPELIIAYWAHPDVEVAARAGRRG